MMHKSSQWTNEWDQLNVPDQLNVWDRPNVLPLGENAWTPVECMRERLNVWTLEECIRGVECMGLAVCYVMLTSPQRLFPAWVGGKRVECGNPGGDRGSPAEADTRTLVP